jgi:hypothetical protein
MTLCIPKFRVRLPAFPRISRGVLQSLQTYMRIQPQALKGEVCVFFAFKTRVSWGRHIPATHILRQDTAVSAGWSCRHRRRQPETNRVFTTDWTPARSSLTPITSSTTNSSPTAYSTQGFPKPTVHIHPEEN